jgi:hypothetical protein
MATAFDDEAQIVFAGEVHSGGDVVGISGRNRVNAGFRGPGIDPAEGLGYTRAVTDVIGIFEIGKKKGRSSAESRPE